MEGDHKWHHGTINDAQLAQAEGELRGDPMALMKLEKWENF